MLRLDNISKVYPVGGGNDVKALDGITINFRKCEFVSILGPSGCGKTTLLNIIGGLDHATDGDLYIDEISTKKFKSKDWDNYRNKRIGFVFQSYNLIPHETVLENVELALNISGVKKEERTKRAKEMLIKVGLEKEMNKKPNQLSGGQCQRVAIARALVNDPEIVLADEPTGALDSVTSVQVMELLKDIAKYKLVIMVTHNSDLAYQYSTRIVKLLDGKLVDDSDPYTYNEVEEKEDALKDQESLKHGKKAKLSFGAAFKLSFKSLLSKYKRTILTCIAGSIGIIGIGAVLAVSSGVSSYIDDVEGELLNSSPLSITETAYDIESLIDNMTSSEKADVIQDNIDEDGYINVDGVLQSIIASATNIEEALVTNNMSEDYINYVLSMDEDWYQCIATYYGEDLQNNVYTDLNIYDQNGDPSTETISLSAIIDIYKAMLSNVGDTAEGEYEDFESLANYIDYITYDFAQLPNDNDFILEQYDVVATTDESDPLPENEDELVLVLNDDGELSNLMLAQFGYYTQDEFFDLIYQAQGVDYDPENIKNSFSYDELLGKSFYYYPNDDIYEQQLSAVASGGYPVYEYDAYKTGEESEGEELKIKSILQVKDDVSYGCLSQGIYYSPKLTEKFIEDSIESQIVQDLNDAGITTVTSTGAAGSNVGIYYNFDFYINDIAYPDNIGYLGSAATLNSMDIYVLTLRQLGGYDYPSEIDIYPVDFDTKEQILSYLDAWNEEGDITVGDTTLTYDERETVTVVDNLSLVFDLVDSITNIVTYALISFTALSLIVSCVMIAIITYVSVMERIKEIGVIRALGGRKFDITMLFFSETFIIGLAAGVIGIALTYAVQGIINVSVGHATGIYTIAALPWYFALMLIAISIVLTLISGLIPAILASRKDPAVALRSEQ